MTNEVPRPNGFTEPSSQERREELEKECEVILSEELTHVSASNYIGHMVDILGEAPDSSKEVRISNPIILVDDNVEKSISFEDENVDGYRFTGVRIRYNPTEDNKTLFPASELIEPDIAGMLYGFAFAKASHFFPKGHFPLKFTSLASSEPIQMALPREQTSNLSLEQTQAFLKKTFDLYKASQGDPIPPAPQFPVS